MFDNISIIPGFYLLSRDSYQNVSLAHIVNGQLEMTEIQEGATDPEPTLRLPVEVWNAFKEVLIDKKFREKSEVEAELGATKYHLEDMRTLLKLKTL